MTFLVGVLKSASSIKMRIAGIPPYKPEHNKQNRPEIKTLWG
jgi:hypothetical protein